MKEKPPNCYHPPGILRFPKSINQKASKDPGGLPKACELPPSGCLSTCRPLPPTLWEHMPPHFGGALTPPGPTLSPSVCVLGWLLLFLLLFSRSVVVQLFRDPMDYSPPDSSVHGVSQARILEWVAISFSRGSSKPRDQTCITCTGRQILYHWATREVPRY